MNCANAVVANIQSYEIFQIVEAVIFQYNNVVFIQMKFSEVNETSKNLFVMIF